jgi:glucose-1-phosphate cytidylyltransferase
MKTIILAGGLGTRLEEETVAKPKPMVEIGGMPILWHIMKIYATYGHNEFYVALGYKGDVIKNYFINYHYIQTDITVHIKSGTIEVRQPNIDDWVIHLVDTGLNTQTGGRIKRMGKLLGNEPFMATYGDGVANVDINQLIAFHEKNGKLATITAVRPPSRFGDIEFNGNNITSFHEKPQVGEGWINGGFFVLQPDVLDYIDGDAIAWEAFPLQTLAQQGQLAAYRHGDFWQCMDTIREKQLLEYQWNTGSAPWKVW